MGIEVQALCCLATRLQPPVADHSPGADRFGVLAAALQVLAAAVPEPT